MNKEMRQNETNYSDRLFFETACETFFAHGFREEHQKLSAYLTKYIDRLSCLRGQWPEPEGRKQAIRALGWLRGMVNEEVSPAVMETFRDELLQTTYRAKKCRLVFLLQEFSIWPAVEPLYRAAIQDGRFEVQAVYVPFNRKNVSGEDGNLQLYRDAGVQIALHDAYDLSAENPDVAIFTKPYNLIPPKYYITEVEKIVKFTIYVPYGMELTTRLIKYGFLDYCHCAVWKHLAYGEIVKRFGEQYGYRDGENIAVWGHPRLDNYRNGLHATVPEAWTQKARGRKVILWCPHHTIVPGPECVSTWQEHYRGILEYFRKKPEATLLWRPHPLLFGAIVKNGLMTQEELDTFLDSVLSMENVILDREADYRPAFRLSDAIITDGTTFCLEYLMTGKPLMLTTADLEQTYAPERIGQSLYIGRSDEDIQAYINMVLQGSDPKKAERRRLSEEYFFLPKNRSISENILDNILASMQRETKDSFESMVQKHD